MSLTNIVDTLYLADGTLASGSLLIQWPTFYASDGHLIQGSSITYTVTNGAVNLNLEPTSNATPKGTVYRVTYSINGSTPHIQEYWNVPAGASPALIAACRVLSAGAQGPFIPQILNINTPVQMGNIATFGAVQDWNGTTGTDNFAAFNSAVIAGFRDIWIPKNCMFIAPSGLIPADLTIWGEDWLSSAILSAANPASATLAAGPGTKLYNLNLQGNTANTPTNNPIGIWMNTSDVNANVVSTGFGSFHSVGGQTGVDITPAFFQVITGLGDAVNGSSGANNTGGGNAGRFDVYPSGAGAIYVGRHAAVYGVNISDLGASAATGVRFSYFSDVATGGSVLQANTRGAAFAGDGLNFNMADVSGSFVGNFVNFLVGSVQKFIIDATGAIQFGASAPKIMAGSGSPAGAVSAPVGSLFLRSDGGASTTLYVKESGTGTSGWVAK